MENIKEGFLKDSILTVIEKTCKVLSRKIGTIISVSPIPTDVISGGRKLSGVDCYFLDGRKMRWNWYSNDTSSNIVSVSYWTKMKIQPDIEVDLHDYNIIQSINAVAEVINNNKIGNVVLEESVNKYNEAEISDAIKQAIKGWSEHMNIDEDKLTNTRMKDLWRSFRFWFEEEGGAQNGFRDMSEASFRNYMLAYFDKYGIKNIYVKVIKSGTASKEKLAFDSLEAKKFNAEIYKMTMDEQREFILNSLYMLAQGLVNSLIIGGQAGAGKTHIVESALGRVKGMNIVYMKGGMKNTEELFKFLQSNNSEKTMIVFDDFDFVFDKKNLDIMKAVMSPDKKRTVTWYSGNINKDNKYDVSDDLDVAIATQKGIEIKKSNKKTYVPTFEFKSKILIITNRPKAKVDSALVSRGTYIEVNFTKEDIIADIRKNLFVLFPEYKDKVTDAMKLEVIDFLSDYITSIDLIDYRIFRTALGIRAVDPYNPLWKKFVMMALSVL